MFLAVGTRDEEYGNRLDSVCNYISDTILVVKVSSVFSKVGSVKVSTSRRTCF